MSQHAKVLADFAVRFHESAKHDLATLFLDRYRSFASAQGTVAIVSSQSWLFAPRYKRFRVSTLKEVRFLILVFLGEGAFDSSQAAGAFVSLGIIEPAAQNFDHEFVGIDIGSQATPVEKAKGLVNIPLLKVNQLDQIKNPDARIVLERDEFSYLLMKYADSRYGLRTSDKERLIRYFWEIQDLESVWRFHQSSVDKSEDYGGREHVLRWENGKGELSKFANLGLASIQGEDAWGKQGIVVSLMRSLPVTLYTGESFDNNCAVVWPYSEKYLGDIWQFCKSPDFNTAVRRIDQSLKVMNATLLKVPFDLEYWQSIAKADGPIPSPHSSDLTQWLFKGNISNSNDPLQGAVARMLGYRWPEQPREEDAIDVLADRDGIVCIPAVRGERQAAERLLDILRTAYDSQWSGTILYKLLTDAGCKPGTSLDDWLRDKFFEEHCKHFHHRPFIWHIWDGRKDGFSCLVNYHKLDHQRLEILTYAYLQDWITAQTAAARDSKPGADLRLAAAQELQNKLKLILEGEPPYHIFVRWKPIHEQPIGWNPDLNDGVRVNIRPFVVANVLRKSPNIKWTKDRGKEPERDLEQFPWFWKNGAFTGDRINDVHLTNAQKRMARDRVGQGSGIT